MKRRTFFQTCGAVIAGLVLPFKKAKAAPDTVVHWSGWHCPDIRYRNGEVVGHHWSDKAINVTCPMCTEHIALWLLGYQ
jgi:hypothetical protein